MPISTYSELKYYISEEIKLPPLNFNTLGLSLQSVKLMNKFIKEYPSLAEALKEGTTNKFTLLSIVLCENPDAFSIKKVTKLKTAKERDKDTKIKTPYRSLKTYLSALGITITYDPNNPTGLYTRVEIADESAQENYLTGDFPIGRLKPIDGKTAGSVEDLSQELEDETELGIDYLFCVEDGEYICPVHYNIDVLTKRLVSCNKPKKKNLDVAALLDGDFPDTPTPSQLEYGNKEGSLVGIDLIKNKNNLALIPETIFLGDSFNATVFSFGRAFSPKLVENILYSSNSYGVTGQSIIKSLYESEDKEDKLSYFNIKPEDGTLYETTRYNVLESVFSKQELSFFPPKRFIPSISHFVKTCKSKTAGNKTLRELVTEDVIKLFSKEELHLFKLAIGRALIGTSGSTAYFESDFKIEHDYRKAVVIVGVPKIGKSTILNGICDALDFCGFDVASGVDFGERFNLGQSILSHLSVFDDMTEARLIKNLSSNNFKSAVSNGRFTVEDKGKDKVEVRSRTVILTNLNDFHPSSLYGLDSGSKNRFIALAALEAPSGQDPWSMVKKISKEMKISPLGIWVRILRDCYDTALQHCEVNGKPPISGVSINDCMDNLALNNKNFFDASPGKTFLILALLSYLLDGVSPDLVINQLSAGIRESDIFINSIKSLANRMLNDESRESFMKAAQAIWEKDNERVSYHPMIGLRELRYKSLRRAEAHVNMYLGSSDFKRDDIEETAIEEIIQLVKNKKGYIRKSFKGIQLDFDNIAESPSTLKKLVQFSEAFDAYLNGHVI